MGKFDDLVPAIQENKVQSLQQNDFAAQDLTPDGEAESLKLSKQFNTPVAFVRDNVEDFKKKAQEPKYGDLLKNNPKLTNFLSRDVSNLAVSKDSLHELAPMEKRRDQFKTTDTFSKELSRAFVGGSNNLSTSAYILGGVYGLAPIDSVAEAVSKSQALVAETEKRRPQYVTEFQSMVEKEAGDVEKAFKKFVGTNYYAELSQGNFKNALDGFLAGGSTVAETMDAVYESIKTKDRLKGLTYSSVEQFANAAPAIAMGLGLAKVGAAAGPIGAAAGFLGGSFAGSYYTEVGSWVQSKMAEKGYDLKDPEDVKRAFSDSKFMAEARAEAERKGLGTAGVDLLFNTVAGGALAKVGKGAGKVKKAAAAVADVGVQAVGESAGEAAGQYAATGKVNFTEAFQEGLLSLGQSVADTTIGAALKQKQEAVEPSAEGTPIPSVEGGQAIEPTPTTSVYAQSKIENVEDAARKLVEGAEKSQKIVHDVGVIQDLGKMVRESKLYQRSPEKLEEFLDVTGEGNEAKSVFFKPSDFDALLTAQGLSPVKAAEILFADKGETYFRSKQTGTPMEVPLSKFLTRTASAENFDDLLSIVRTSPNGLTVQEAREVNKELPNILAEIAVASKAQEEKRKLVEQETLQVKKEVKQQLAQGGIFDSEQTNAAAETIASLYRTEQSDVYEGKSVAEIYKENPVKLEYFNKVPEGVQAFEQKVEGVSRINGQQLKEHLRNTINENEAMDNDTVAQDAIADELISKYGDEWELHEIPIKKIEGYPKQVAEWSEIKTRVEEYLGLSTEAPAIIAVPMFRKKKLNKQAKQEGRPTLYAPDGKHRLLVANKEGNKTIKAWLPVDKKTGKAPLYQADKKKTVRGFFDPLTKLVGLLKKDANISTPLHEVLGHMWLERMGENVEYLNTLKQTQELTLKQEDYLKRAADVLEFLEAKSFKDITTPQHEKWAAHYEAYLMEGKAPSKRLEGAFEKFKTWFTAIYKDILGLERDRKIKINLSDKLRNVFDRLLATEEELKAAQKNYTPLFKDPISAGMGKDLANKWYKVSSEASEAASNTLRKPVMDDYLKKQQTLYKEEKAKVREDISQGLDEQPNQKVLKAIETDPMVRDLAPEFQAEMYGYDSVKEFQASMDQARNQRRLVDEATELEMQKRYPDSLFELEEDAIEAVHNDIKAQQLRIEAEFLAEKLNDKQVAARLIARLPTSKALKEEAARRVRFTDVKDIKPYLYERAERSAAKDAAAAFKQLEGKSVEETEALLQAAFEAKRQELLNHEMYKAALAAQKQVDKKFKDYRKKLSKKNEDLAKSRDVDYVNAARAVAANYGITRSEKTAEEYLDKVRKYDKQAYEGLIKLVDSASEGAAFYKDVTFDQFEKMTRAVDAIWSMAGSVNKQTIEGKKIDTEEVVQAMVAQTQGLIKDGKSKEKYTSTKSKHGDWKLFSLGFKNATLRIEHLVDVFDDGNINGAWRKFLWERAQTADNTYNENHVKRLKEHRALLDNYKPDAALFEKEIVADALPPVLDPTDNSLKPFKFENKWELLSFLTHIGNDSNKSKALRGMGWATENEGVLDTAKWDAFLGEQIKNGTITEVDMDFIQGLWDFYESIKPDLQRAHKATQGYYFEEVTAREFTVKFPNGTEKVYAGGYVPLKYDRNFARLIGKLEDLDIFERNNPSMALPSVGLKSTISRNEKFAQRVSLDFNQIGANLDWAMRFAHLEPTAKELARLIRDKGLEAELNRIDPKLVETLESWLTRSAQQRSVVPTEHPYLKTFDRTLEYVRVGAAMNVMALNLSVAAQNFTGLFPAVLKVKPKYLVHGFNHWMTGLQKGDNGKMIGNKAVNEMLEESPTMKTLYGENVLKINAMVRDVVKNPSKFEKGVDAAKEYAQFLNIMSQDIVNTIVYYGAKEQAIAEKKDEKTAIREATAAVTLTQGSARPLYISASQVGSPVYQMFIQFFNYFNNLMNLNQAEAARVINKVGVKKGGGRLFYIYMAGFMAPLFTATLISKAFSGKDLDEDEDDKVMDDLGMTFMQSQFGGATAMAPIVGMGFQKLYNKAFTQTMYDDTINLGLTISTIDKFFGFPVEAYDIIVSEAEFSSKTVKDGFSFMGTLSQTPIGVLGRPAGYLMDVSSGEAEPSGPIDFTRGLLTGKKGSNK